MSHFRKLGLVTEMTAVPSEGDTSGDNGRSEKRHKPTSDQIDPTTICHKRRTRETQFAGEEGDAFGSVGALIAQPPTRLRRVS
jgi:hypothetical protein